MNRNLIISQRMKNLQSNLNSESQFKYVATSLFHIEGKTYTYFTSWHIKNESWDEYFSLFSDQCISAAKYKLIGFVLDTDIFCRIINIFVWGKSARRIKRRGRRYRKYRIVENGNRMSKVFKTSRKRHVAPKFQEVNFIPTRSM